MDEQGQEQTAPQPLPGGWGCIPCGVNARLIFDPRFFEMECPRCGRKLHFDATPPDPAPIGGEIDGKPPFFAKRVPIAI